MNVKQIQILGIFFSIIFAGFIVWFYSKEPKNLSEAVAKATVSTGFYEVDKTKFIEGLQFFRSEKFSLARESFQKADPEKRDAETQFYIAYSFYRQGFGKIYNDDKLFQEGLTATNQLLSLSPDFKSSDPDLKIKTPSELKIEFEQGLEKTVDDLNPLKVLRERK